MELSIFTLPFDDVSEGFPDELIQQFCLNKKVHQIQPHFFIKEGKPFWSVAIQYETVVKDKDKIRTLSEADQLLFNRLKAWRKDRANKEGIPVYLVATNAQFLKIIQLKCQTLESFKLVKGYGKKRLEKYGKDIIAIIKAFFEERQNNESKQGNSSVEPEHSDIPFLNE